MARSIYICYFGIREPLVQTQVLPYLRELIKGGHEITLLTFEPRGFVEGSEKESYAGEGIEWHWLRYHKRPSVPATLFDLANGIRYVIKLARKHKFDIFHVRGHIPAPIGVIAKRICGGKLLFDIRGFLPEEYVDAGVWDRNGSIYKTFKKVERWVMEKADGFVVLTEKARKILFPEAEADSGGRDRFGRPVEVIPCCVDISRFGATPADSREATRNELGIADRKAVIYVGSFGGWYLTDEMIDLVEALREDTPDLYFMILTQRDQEAIHKELVSRGFNESDFLVTGVTHRDIPRYLSAADVAISLIKPSYSKQSSSPTKIAEYLAMGLPVISNRGVGDVDELIERNGVGALLTDLSSESYKEAGRAIDALGAVRDRCTQTAREMFDLETVGGPSYRRMYDALTQPDRR